MMARGSVMAIIGGDTETDRPASLENNTLEARTFDAKTAVLSAARQQR
jgi:hypothetical protein